MLPAVRSRFWPSRFQRDSRRLVSLELYMPVDQLVKPGRIQCHRAGPPMQEYGAYIYCDRIVRRIAVQY